MDTTSQLAAQLKAKNPEMAEELLKRMEIRKKIVHRNPDKSKTFESVGNLSREEIENRTEKIRKMKNIGTNMVTKLENLKYQQEHINLAKQMETVTAPVSVLPKMNSCFEISELASFSAERGVNVLNLDKFICSTDKRVPIYNSKGFCVFCEVHNVKATQHTATCPYTFCNCAECYLAGKINTKDEVTEEAKENLDDHQ